jgi:peptidoglycan/xylan/chitin deacetylase (PgdA/CDA1 family)
MYNYSRRDVMKKMGIGGMAIAALPSFLLAEENAKGKKHFVTLSFDDGFRKSSLRTAEIYENYKLSACINVIATAHLPLFEQPGPYHGWPVGDFGLWNELKARGHEIMMHGYKHANKKKITFDEGKDLILKCIEYFSKNLKGFDPKESVFNFPYNASSPELEEWLVTQVKAFRTEGPFINELPHKGQTRLTCNSYGPGNCEEHLIRQIDKLLEKSSGWLIYNTHGLDEEGWGPMSADALDKLLKRLTAIDTVEILPAGKALAKF